MATRAYFNTEEESLFHSSPASGTPAIDSTSRNRSACRVIPCHGKIKETIQNEETGQPITCYSFFWRKDEKNSRMEGVFYLCKAS